ncbi:hypothetical protein BaRGS_00007221 [Batillaria attramentaria]|uniref:Uncharacterized protein n=1 Tax=Batillaria attramentaria TaxID=370345 RepID=A0ABD0LQZ5_9CAEN
MIIQWQAHTLGGDTKAIDALDPTVASLATLSRVTNNQPSASSRYRRTSPVRLFHTGPCLVDKSQTG